MARAETDFTEQGHPQRGMHFLISSAALVIILWGIHYAQSVLALVLVSGFLAVLGTPAVLWLTRKRMPPAVAVLFVIAGMTVILLAVALLAGLSIKRILDSWPFYQTRLQQQVFALKTLSARMGFAINDKVLLGYVTPEALRSLSGLLIARLGAVLSGTALVLLTVSFILFEAPSFPVKLRAALGEPRAHFPDFVRFVNDISRYVVIQTAVSLTVGVLAAAWLAVLRVDFAVLFGLLAFLLNYVPNVGSVIAIIPAALLTFIQFGAGRAALAVAGYVVFTFVLGNVVQPRLMGRKLGLSTLVVFLSLVFWGSLLGLAGMVLCVPLTMVLKFGLERSESTQFIAALLDRERSGASAPAAPQRDAKD